jgi:lipid-A-disaccharide synthase
LGAADAVLLASGTAALEALLLRCPMVVAYKVSSLTYNLVMGLGLLKIKNVSLPNLLAERDLVPEFMQARANPEELGPAVLKLLDDKQARDMQIRGLQDLTGVLRVGADARAADAVLALADSRRRRPE